MGLIYHHHMPLLSSCSTMLQAHRFPTPPRRAASLYRHASGFVWTNIHCDKLENPTQSMDKLKSPPTMSKTNIQLKYEFEIHKYTDIIYIYSYLYLWCQFPCVSQMIFRPNLGKNPSGFNSKNQWLPLLSFRTDPISLVSRKSFPRKHQTLKRTQHSRTWK